MATDIEAEDDFEPRFREIQHILHTFHQDFIEENTKNTHDMKAVGELKAKIEYIYDALKTFLSRCLGEHATCESTIKDVKVMMGAEEDAELTSQVKTLLTELCPLMFPWNVHTHAKVGGLFYLFGTVPYSPVRIDGAVPDPLTQ